MKKLKFIVLIVLFIVSTIYSYKKPQVPTKITQKLTITLEGAFLKTGKIPIQQEETLGDIVKRVGIKPKASLDSLNLKLKVIAEKRYYLPLKKKKMISLNHGILKDFMSLKGIGPLMAQKIIDYRQKQTFMTIEDIMNVKGVGEKRYLLYRDKLIL